VLLEDAEPFSALDVLGPGNIEAVLRKYGSLSQEEACGALESFVGDPLWACLRPVMMKGWWTCAIPSGHFRRC